MRAKLFPDQFAEIVEEDRGRRWTDAAIRRCGQDQMESREKAPLHEFVAWAHRATWRVRGSARACSWAARAFGAVPEEFVGSLWTGAKLIVPGAPAGLPKAVWELGVYEQLTTALISRIVPGRTFFDVGANVGYFTVLAASAGAARVVAFEPLPTNQMYLARNLDGPRFALVQVLQTGLGDRADRIALYGQPAMRSTGSVSAFPGPGDSKLGEARIARLDDLMQEQGLPGPDLVKIDIEGYELAALHGMTKAISDHAPVVLLELNDALLRRAGASRDAILELLGANGYSRIFDVDARRIRPLTPSTFNALAIPVRRWDELAGVVLEFS